MSRPSISRTRSKANRRRRNRPTAGQTHHEGKIEAGKKRRNPTAEKKSRNKGKKPISRRRPGREK
jgi:hypothetical protein